MVGAFHSLLLRRPVLRVLLLFMLGALLSLMTSGLVLRLHHHPWRWLLHAQTAAVQIL